jgi:hypothetical protein
LIPLFGVHRRIQPDPGFGNRGSTRSYAHGIGVRAFAGSSRASARVRKHWVRTHAGFLSVPSRYRSNRAGVASRNGKRTTNSVQPRQSTA